MRILGIGVDIVETARIQRSIDRFGSDFLERVFCPGEIEYCRAMKHAAQHFGARFAAKEAISKAFGTGIGTQIGWRDLEVRRKGSGEPFVELHGPALQLAERLKVESVWVSFSHSVHYSVAQAIVTARSAEA